MFAPEKAEKLKKNIWQAIEENDLGALKALAQLPKFGLKVKDNLGHTPLLEASQFGHLDIVKWLLEAGGASVAEKTSGGMTALLWAAFGGHLPVIQWLLQAGGVSIAEKDRYDTTVLLWAASRGHLPVIQWLLEVGGASIVEKDKFGMTALLLAADQGHLPVVQWLLEAGGASIVEKSGFVGRTALLLAASRGHLPMVQWLLHSGFSRLDECDHQKQSFWDLLNSKYSTLHNHYQAFLNQPNEITFDAVCAYQKEGQLILRYAVLERLVSQQLWTLMNNHAQTLYTWYRSLSFCQHLYLVEYATKARNLDFYAFLERHACYPDCFPTLSIHPGVLRSQAFRKNNWPDLIEYLKQPRFVTIEEKTTYIHTIDLSGGQLKERYLFELAEVLIHQPQLTQLNLEGSTLSYLSFQKFIKILRRHPNQEHLIVNVNLKTSTLPAELRSVKDSCLCILQFHYPDLIAAYRENNAQQFESILIPTLETMTKSTDKTLLALVIAWSAAMGLFDKTWVWLQTQPEITLSELLSLIPQVDAIAAGKFAQKAQEAFVLNQKMLNQLTEENQEQAKIIQTKQTELDQLMEENQTQNQAMQLKQEAFDQLHQQYVELQQEHNTAKRDIQLNKTIYQETIENLFEKQSQLSKEKALAENELQKTQNDINEFKEKIRHKEALQEENSSLHEKLSLLTQRETDLKTQVQQLTDQLQVQTNLVANKINQLIEMRAYWEQRQDSASRQLNKIEEEMKSANEILERLEKTAEINRPKCLIAVHKGDVEAVKLVENEVKEARDFLGRNALHVAVRGKSVAMVEYLLTLTFDHLAKDDFGKTALDYVLEKQKDEMANIIFKQYSSVETEENNKPIYKAYRKRDNIRLEKEATINKHAPYLKDENTRESGRLLLCQIDVWLEKLIASSIGQFVDNVQNYYENVLLSEWSLLSEPNKKGVNKYLSQQLKDKMIKPKDEKRKDSNLIQQSIIQAMSNFFTEDDMLWKEIGQRLVSDYNKLLYLKERFQLDLIDKWASKVIDIYQSKFNDEFNKILKSKPTEREALLLRLKQYVQESFTPLLAIQDNDFHHKMSKLEEELEDCLDKGLEKVGEEQQNSRQQNNSRSNAQTGSSSWFGSGSKTTNQSVPIHRRSRAPSFPREG